MYKFELQRQKAQTCEAIIRLTVVSGTESTSNTMAKMAQIQAIHIVPVVNTEGTRGTGLCKVFRCCSDRVTIILSDEVVVDEVSHGHYPTSTVHDSWMTCSLSLRTKGKTLGKSTSKMDLNCKYQGYINHVHALKKTIPSNQCFKIFD